VALLLSDAKGAIVPFVVDHWYGGLPPDATNVSAGLEPPHVSTQDPSHERLSGLVPGVVRDTLTFMPPVAPATPPTEKLYEPVSGNCAVKLPPLCGTPVKENSVLPFGFNKVTLLLRSGKVTLLICTLIHCPAVPSKTTSAILFAVVIFAVKLLPPIVIRPVDCTSAATKGAEGIKKSAVLVTLPRDVWTEICPDPVPVGTVVLMVVEVEEVTFVIAPLNRTIWLVAVASKFVPVIVTAAPTVPTVGVKFVIVGAPTAPVTLKATELAAEPAGVVTLIRPEVAPAGTVAVNELAVAVVTVAAVPLNVTVFWLGVGL
jgi:hypothetical protein